MSAARTSSDSSLLVPCPAPTQVIPKRILVIRLDRLGDVILSTPVLKALREGFPHAFIAMMVRPVARDIVDGNPWINEVIVYEKEGCDRSIPATVRFARRLRRFGFDTALILHPSNRSHWIPYLAGIRTRIGYDRKCRWLLTHRMPHDKQEGAKHESLYTLEMLKPFKIKDAKPKFFIPIHANAARRVGALLAESSIKPTDCLIALHPSASCVSKRWMPERFAQVADRLIAQGDVRVCLVADVKDSCYAKEVAGAMQHPVLDFAGRLSVAELAALLGRCKLLVSNDSGPVHIAAALGIPVVDIFGRNQRGLSAVRWGPLGEGHIVLHKEVGCVTCLAHECDIGFLCLTELSVNEVYEAARSILARSQRATNPTARSDSP